MERVFFSASIVNELTAIALQLLQLLLPLLLLLLLLLLLRLHLLFLLSDAAAHDTDDNNCDDIILEAPNTANQELHRHLDHPTPDKHHAATQRVGSKCHPKLPTLPRSPLLLKMR
jgi:hypothetical protein